MDITTTKGARVPQVVDAGSGHHLHFLNHLATVKVSAHGTGAMSVVEFQAGRGIGPPLHLHADEDELVIIHEGEIACESGGERILAGEGAVVLLPCGVPHTFQVRSDLARFTCVTASRTAVPRFDRMVAELGVPTDVPSLPTPGYVDATRVADVCTRHGITIVGPPPEPLPRPTSPSTNLTRSVS